MSGEQILSAQNVSVSYRHAGRWLRAVDSVSFTLAVSEVLGLAGESGSGKTSLVIQALGYPQRNARLDSGRLWFRGRDILSMDAAELRHLRGNRISYVPQNPTTSLSPGMKVGRQIAEVLTSHDACPSRAALRRRLDELLDIVGLSSIDGIADRYPHQLSGGQQQRVVIAMAVACAPDLVILDEPTTGLDMTTQKQVIDLLQRLRHSANMAMLYVTHDLGVLHEIADRVGIMYAGHIVEVAPTHQLFARPRHPYTIGLLGSRPLLSPDRNSKRTTLRGLLRRNELPPGCPFAPRCDYAEPSCRTSRQSLEAVAPEHRVACQRHEAVAAATADLPQRVPLAGMRVGGAGDLLELEDVTLGYQTRGGLTGFLSRKMAVVRGLDLSIGPGETLALVGESGSGKSTIARAISGLIEPMSGAIRYRQEPLPASIRRRPGRLCREIQYVFQNPDASLNPRMTVGRILEQPLDVFFSDDKATRREKVAHALESVQIDTGYVARYPDQLSGGERQRVAIARAMIVDPVLLLCDEVLSALDVSVQAHIIELLEALKQKSSIAMLFISHDLAVVRTLADRVAVLLNGHLVESGTTEEVFSAPFHPYTLSLLRAVPGSSFGAPETTANGSRTLASSARGCVFAGRCPARIGPICDTTVPDFKTTGASLRIRCHHDIDQLERQGTRWPPRELAAEAGPA